MILTKHKIKEQFSLGNIFIDPFEVSQLNPNSYNYRLEKVIKVLKPGCGEDIAFEDVEIPKSGLLLKPRQMYLGSTFETIGSDHYAMSLIGRSSLGRLGLFLQCVANLGHTGASHKWTLEIVASKPIIVYPHMIIGQVSFWSNLEQPVAYDGYYGKFNVPTMGQREVLSIQF